MQHQEEASEYSNQEESSDVERSLEFNAFESSPNENDHSNNFGFKPLSSERPEGRPEKRKRVETEEARRLKTEIQLLLCRHPKLIPRTSHEIMEKLNTLSDDELFNVHINALNDVAELKDNPSGAAVITACTKPLDLAYLPGFTQQCLNDSELRRNVEAEVTLYLGRVSGMWLIAFQLLNNAYTVFTRQYTSHALALELPINETPIAKFNREEEEEREKKRRATGEDAPLITPILVTTTGETTRRHEDATHANDATTLESSEHAASLRR